MDWIALFQDNNIDYVTRGSNTKKGEVSVRCPWCGEDDPGYHLGISLTKEAYGCWRNVNHAGKSPYKLIQALLGCSYTQAKLVTGQYNHSDPDTLNEALSMLTGHENPVKQPSKQRLKLPEGLRPILPYGTTTRFHRYLLNRGFINFKRLGSHYKIKCCATGKWKDRIIIPIYLKGHLVNWTGRALQNPINAPRYMTATE